MKRELVQWVIENRDRYTPDALRDKLIAARHPPDDIELLLSTSDLSRFMRDAEVVDDARRRVTRIVLAAYVGALILLGALTVASFGSAAVLGLPILGAALAIGALIGVLSARGVAGATIAQGATLGTALALIVPLVLLAIVAGICVASSGAINAL